jgi:hypothetical protein
MTNLRSRIEQLEEKVWQNISAMLDRYLAGRSVEDVEFFCVHGYLPETPIPGDPYHPSGSWPKWKDHKRAIAGRTEGEREFFCAHGYWPKAGGGNNHGNPQKPG